MNSDQWTYVGMAIFVVLILYICYWIVGTQYPGFLTKLCTCKCCHCKDGSLEHYDSSEVPRSAESKEKSRVSSKGSNSKSAKSTGSDVSEVNITETKTEEFTTQWWQYLKSTKPFIIHFHDLYQLEQILSLRPFSHLSKILTKKGFSSE